jgi:hypothetical protein
MVLCLWYVGFGRCYVHEFFHLNPMCVHINVGRMFRISTYRHNRSRFSLDWLIGTMVSKRKSGRQDLNLRPLGPQPSALPDYATPRCFNKLNNNLCSVVWNFPQGSRWGNLRPSRHACRGALPDYATPRCFNKLNNNLCSVVWNFPQGSRWGNLRPSRHACRDALPDYATPRCFPA